MRMFDLTLSVADGELVAACSPVVFLDLPMLKLVEIMIAADLLIKRIFMNVFVCEI
jgi:hypothetical protein